ncbi:MAG: threonylcarbamoyl-AMP synthase [Clostridia bacterium]|nr:threonylcarbamoyl-AMP synthase [Clostridia bacterium]
MRTKTVRIDVNDTAHPSIARAAEIIRSGGLVVFPTETVYGLGADGTNPTAAEKIYGAKGRPADNPLIIHIADPVDAEKYTYTNEVYYRLAEQFMPGPITVIMRAKDAVALNTRAGLPTVAVRCPRTPIARELIRLSGVPIAAPSANLSGSPSPTCAKHVIDDMMERVDMIIDGGDSDIGVESTIVKIEDDGSLTLLRPGAVTLDELAAVCGEVSVAEAVLSQLKDGEAVLSPGMKYKHYAPKTPLVLLDGDSDGRFLYTKGCKNTTAVLCYAEEYGRYAELLGERLVFNLGASSDKFSHAKKLFYYLREADTLGADQILAPLPSLDGMGMALYNRMIRAAAHKIIKTGE